MNPSPSVPALTPKYSEFGPVWTVCPMERVPECASGTETVWLVVDLDYDTKNFCGNCIAECSVELEARQIASALNTTTYDLPELIRTMKAMIRRFDGEGKKFIKAAHVLNEARAALSRVEQPENQESKTANARPPAPTRTTQALEGQDC